MNTIPTGYYNENGSVINSGIAAYYPPLSIINGSYGNFTQSPYAPPPYVPPVFAPKPATAPPAPVTASPAPVAIVAPKQVTVAPVVTAATANPVSMVNSSFIPQVNTGSINQQAQQVNQPQTLLNQPSVINPAPNVKDNTFLYGAIAAVAAVFILLRKK